jgi:branched-chain amino acid transport system permease protein
MTKLKFPKLLALAVLIYGVIQALFQFEIINGYILHIINQSLIYVILAVSLNLINGITGQFSLGHMAFAGVGAYASGTITTLVLKLNVADPGSMYIFILAILGGGVAAAIIGFLIGFPSLRLKGDYLAIVTLGFGEIIRTVFNNIDYVGGPRGLLGIPKFSNFTVIFIAAFLTIVVIRNLIQSSHGRAMISIRENELAAELVGINTTKYKVLAFTIGAFFAGIAGGLFAHLLQLAHPTQFGFIKSVEVLIMIYVGGVGSLTGATLAAFALTFLSEGLRLGIRSIADATGLPIGGEWRMVVYSLLLIFIMLFRTEGIMGTKEARIVKIKEVE